MSCHADTKTVVWTQAGDPMLRIAPGCGITDDALLGVRSEGLFRGPSCRAFRSAAAALTLPETLLKLDGVRWDTSGLFDATSGTIIVQRSGWYVVAFTHRVDTIADAGLNTGIVKASGKLVASSSNGYSSGHAITQLLTGAKLELWSRRNHTDGATTSNLVLTTPGECDLTVAWLHE